LLDRDASYGQAFRDRIQALFRQRPFGPRESPSIAATALRPWFGLLAPAKNSNEAVSHYAGWFTAALRVPEVRKNSSPRGCFRSVCAARIVSQARAMMRARMLRPSARVSASSSCLGDCRAGGDASRKARVSCMATLLIGRWLSVRNQVA